MLLAKFFSTKTVLLIWLSCTLPAHCQNARLLTSYLPASMQALAYYIDQLQYEPSIKFPIEPFNAYLSIIKNESHIPQITKPTTNNDVWNVPSKWQETEIPTTPPTLTTTHPNIINGWKPPYWWQKPFEVNNSTILPLTEDSTTVSHEPGIFAPDKSIIFHLHHDKLKNHKAEGYEIFSQFNTTDTETLAELPLFLINDIRLEMEHDYFTNDVESLDNFLRLYDDNYGRETHSKSDAILNRWSSSSTAGKKRVPPNKPYVEFLLIYDLLKRDAKAENLSKYDGYSDEILEQLHSLSLTSAPRQLYTLFTRMLERRDIQRSDVVSRIQSINKELGNPQTVTSKALQHIPAMKFLI